MANSNGYYVYIRLMIILAPEWRWLTVDAASIAPAMPPEIKDTVGGVLDSYSKALISLDQAID